MNEHDLRMYRGIIADRDNEIRLLRIAVTRYCEKWRMGTVEPMDVQQAIDRAFEHNQEEHAALIQEEYKDLGIVTNQRSET